MDNTFWKNGLILLVLFNAIIFSFIPDFIPNATFTSYNISSSVQLTGEYEENTLLNNAEHLHPGLLKGPASLVVINNELYTGIHGGDVIKVSDEINPVVKFGLPCDGQWQESICGRPFGLASDNSNNMYIADAYYGIWKYNLKTKNGQQLVSQNESIYGRIPKIFNSIAVSKNGDIYWTDSSTDVDIQNGVYAMFLDGTGRLLKYSVETRKNTVLVNNLYFPTGLIISPNEEYIIISEMITSRLLRHYISGDKMGITEVFLDGLPGFPDRLKTFCDYIVVPLVHARDASEPVFFQSVSPYTFIRRVVSYGMAYYESTIRLIGKLIPLEIFEKIVHIIGHFETVSRFAPKRVTILIVNWEGQVVESWHNLDGTLKAIGDIQIHKNNIFYGSPYNLYIGRTAIPDTKLNCTGNVGKK